eukprot:TRINITY_DN2600_c0_g1_i1.p1 TRINITY_DN2600_c0_g1~~TRINITY_DN2600_c0_g1_i1.p1  ORF type:complete len:438 (-),score=67.47 TRINITY_DN2600_c0_g1_i1:473-1786(-)
MVFLGGRGEKLVNIQKTLYYLGIFSWNLLLILKMDAYLIELVDEHPAQHVVSHLTKLIAKAENEQKSEEFQKKCNQFIDEDKAVELVEEILKQLSLVVVQATPSDLQAILSVVLFMLRDFEKEYQPKMVEQFLESMDKVEDSKVEDQEAAKAANLRNQMRLDAMLTSYNIIGSTKALFKAISYALSAQLHEILAPGLVQQMIPSIDKLGLSEDELFDLILQMVKLLEKCKGETPQKEGYKLTEMGIKKVPSARIQEAKGMAQRIVGEVLSNPDTLRVDIMDYPAVQNLEKDPEYSQAYKLLGILKNADIEAFVKGDFKSVLEKVKIDESKFLLKMRTLKLIRLGDKGGSRLTFSEIAKTLGCKEEEVEGVIVHAIGRGMMVGRINQVEKFLDVTSTVCVSMDGEAWKDLQERVRSLRKSLSNVQGTMSQTLIEAGIA